jgi:hypothetical protein
MVMKMVMKTVMKMVITEMEKVMVMKMVITEMEKVKMEKLDAELFKRMKCPQLLSMKVTPLLSMKVKEFLFFKIPPIKPLPITGLILAWKIYSKWITPSIVFRVNLTIKWHHGFWIIQFTYKRSIIRQNLISLYILLFK